MLACCLYDKVLLGETPISSPISLLIAVMPDKVIEHDDDLETDLLDVAHAVVCNGGTGGSPGPGLIR